MNGISLNRQSLMNSLSPKSDTVSVSRSNESLSDVINSLSTQPPVMSMSDQSVDNLLVSQIHNEFTITKGVAISNYEYSAEELAIRTVVSHQNEGLARNENSEQLLSRLDQSAANIRNAYSNTSAILADIGQLGPNQRSFLASSEQRVERTMGSYQEAIYRHQNEDGDKNRFSLTIQTQEGDTITISFSSAQGNDEESMQTVDTFKLAYEVDGELSKEEHAALNKMLTGVGELADDFFAESKHAGYATFYEARQTGNDLNIDFLSNFDNAILSGVDLSFSTSGGGGDSFTQHNLDLSYQFDPLLQSQQLDLEFQSGLKQTDFSIDMSVFGKKDEQQLKQYLAVMEQSFEQNNELKNTAGRSELQQSMDKRFQQQASSDFSMFKSAFSTMSEQANRYSQIATLAEQEFNGGRALVAELTKQTITSDPRYTETLNKNQLGAGISGLADFSAQFNFNVDFIETVQSLDISQKTTNNASGGYQGVSQQKEISSDSQKRSGPDSVKQQHKQEYTVNAAIEGNSLVGLNQKHNKMSEHKTHQYVFDDNDKFIKVMTKIDVEQSSDESNIKLIQGLWLEQSAKETEKTSTEVSLNGNIPTDVKRTNNYSHQQLTKLIGDLKPLIDNEEAIEKLNEKRRSIDSFMRNTADKLS